ncbi:MAG: hypothetical protein GY804_13280 [Alphaproteobacteria bacterium]|nr:hypothetical protein [Alphaproteobacteria bacterium]
MKSIKIIIITCVFTSALAGCGVGPYHYNYREYPGQMTSDEAAYLAEMQRRQRFYQVVNPYTNEITTNDYENLYRSREGLLYELPTTDEY